MVDAVGVPVEFIPQMRADPMWQGLETVAHTLPYDLAIMGDNSIPTSRVVSVKAPTLVVDGGASPDWLRNAAQALADALPNAQRRTLEGQTHGVSPEAIAPVLKEFFAG
jgi:pimeloyl-ACP methyl ester carboxylesterase